MYIGKRVIIILVKWCKVNHNHNNYPVYFDGFYFMIQRFGLWAGLLQGMVQCEKLGDKVQDCVLYLFTLVAMVTKSWSLWLHGGIYKLCSFRLHFYIGVSDSFTYGLLCSLLGFDVVYFRIFLGWCCLLNYSTFGYIKK